MSLKDLFNNPNLKSVTSASLQDVIDDTESLGYIESYLKEQNQFRTNIDFSSAENFVRFGSAEKYYLNSIERIYKTYPYDGSRKEQVDFFLSSSDLDMYIFENEYPRTNGYANFIHEAADSGAQGVYFFPSTTDEYILIKGGPNTSQRAKETEITDVSGDYKDGYANLYDLAKNRENNLKIGGIDGNTVEFWLKKDAYVTDQEYFEFVLDTHVTGTSYTDDSYGRLVVALATTGTADNTSNQAFFLSYASGSTDNIRIYLGSDSVTTGTIADGQWHHYAIRMKTSGNNTVFDLFVDGEYDDSSTALFPVGYVSGAIVATIGSQAAPFYDGTRENGDRGWSPFSGSIDEFRYWKVWRDSQQIGRQYIEPVGAGTNTDDANTHLGVYYKFNEGITQTASIDSTVLDYSGRISNGSWTGYSSLYSRNTGSAFVESGKAPFEFKDPILYSFHPDVVSLVDEKTKIGKEYDYANPNSMYNSIPSWITDQEYGKENPALENLTQIISSYFDTLHSQIENLSDLKHPSYTSGTSDVNQKPYFFNNQILQSYGFPYIPDLFKDASFLEYFRNRDDKELFEEKLYNIKNTIYNNIYNNLAYINKSKGTEKAFRNFFRCFGLDEEILKLRFYSNNGEFEYTDNVKSISAVKKYVNFSLTGSSEATVYQYKVDDSSTSFISGTSDASSGLESTGYGFTLECQTVFPLVPSQAEYNTLIANKDYTGGKLINAIVKDKDTSIFGMRTAGTTENDLTVPTNDYAGFVVKTIKDQEFDQRCKFRLSPTENSYFPEIETDYFEDVFDETKWNFAVVVKPTNYGQSNFVSGSEDVNTYDIVFMGTRVILGDTLDNFELTSTISNVYGKTIMTQPKRVFIGAERENVSGSLTTRAFSNVTDCRFWLKPLVMSEIKKHNTDIYNYGVNNPHDSAYLFQDDLTEVRVSNIETLALHWNFLNLTSSDASGQFEVDDFSSGSADDNRYGDLSGIISRQHSGRGDYFIASSVDTFARKNVYNAKTDLPGYINSSDMINITNFDDMTFTRETRPISYFMTIEKSMYQTISEDMIKIFSTMVDYGSLVGKQYNKYRVENKDLKHLRQLFFENISNTPKLEKYIDYYKWFDTSLNVLVSNLIPIVALRDENDSVIRPVVEEHSFNKEKYLSQFPTLELKATTPEGAVNSINELLYPWKQGHAPISQDESENCLWFKERAERSGIISSGDTNVDSDRQELIDAINNLNDASPPNLSGSDGSYQGSTYALRRFARPLNLTVEKRQQIHGGGNAYENKKVGFWDSLRKRPTPAGGTEGGLISVEPPETDINMFKDCDDNLELNKGKRKYAFSVGATQDDGDQFTGVFKGDLVFPFSLYSSSVTGNPAMADLADFQANLAITNLHHDNYGPYNDVPMQGPFTEKFVGGRAYRHVMTNFTFDNAVPDGEGERLEGWRITGSGDAIDLVNPASPKSVYFREEYAKRPVNIKNIQQLTSSLYDADDQATDAFGVTRIGNYSETYEIVMTNGRSINNRYMAESDGDLPTTFTDSTAVSGVVDFALPRRDLTGSNKAIIVNRFSAPGDPATMAEGMLDVAAAEYSVYNALPFRNLPVRTALQELFADHANQFGYFSDARTVADYESADWATYPGGSSSANPDDYSGTGSFHKVNRNGRQAVRFSGSTGYEDDSYLDTVKYDNYHVQHQIPQTDVQYSWITSSIVEDYSGSALYGFEQPDFSNASFASSDLTFVSASDSGSAEIDVDFAGLNTLILDGVDSSANLLSSSDYFNDNIESLADVLTTNALLLHRQGPYGGANWKLYKKDNHPIIRTQKKENRLSFVKETLPGLTSLRTTIEPPISSKFKPIEFNSVIYNPKPSTPLESVVEQNVYFNQTYYNNLVRFSNKINGENDIDLNNGPFYTIVSGYQTRKMAYGTIKNLINKEVSPDVNPIKFTNNIRTNEVFWPKPHYAYLSSHRQREDYVSGFWRNNPGLRREKIRSIEFNDNPYDFHDLTFQGSYSHLRQFAVTASFVGAETVIDYSNPAEPEVTTAQAFTASIWSLDAREDFATASPGRIASSSDEGFNERSSGFFNPIVSASDGSGILQNSMYPYSCYARVSASNLTSAEDYAPWLTFALPQYNRRIAGVIASDTDHEYKFGDTKWEAGAQSGLTPFYDTYSEFIEDIKRTGKDHSIIPEFRISNHMDYYLNTSKDFLTKPPGVYEITGASIQNSDDSEFAVQYLHSDFLKTFNIIDQDFNELENSKITISADALVKFLPYDGFYPADRTVELTKLFYDSYSGSFSISGSLHLYDIAKTPPGFDSEVNAQEPIPPHQSGITNPVWKSLFAPGILYNSIKSGIAVDYPVHTTASTVQFTGTANQRNSLNYLVDIPRIDSDFNYRIPFEALLNPEDPENIPESVVDSEPHPSASLSLTSSLSSGGKLNYKLAMNNFLASTIQFFKPDGKLTSIVSESDGNRNFGFSQREAFSPDKEYRMRVVCYNGLKNRLSAILETQKTGSDSGANNISYSASFNWNPISCVMYAQTGSDSILTADYYGSSFGPPVNVSSSTADNVAYILRNPGGLADASKTNLFGSASFEPFTPPYYGGYSHIEYVYKPDVDSINDINLTDVFTQMIQSASYVRGGEINGTFANGSNDETNNVAYLNRMQLSASLNVQLASKPTVITDKLGNPIEIIENDANSVLVIQPKWETPILNFKNVDVTLPNIGSGSVARGMWHQYGRTNVRNEGIFIQVQDLDKSEMADSTLTGSLADLIGLDKTKRSLGTVAGQKKISEGIVAIPFIKQGDDKKFFTIDRATIDAAILINDEKTDLANRIIADGAQNPSEEILDMVKKMRKFVIPPHLDFVTNDTIDSFAMFIFDFEVTLDQTDLTNIWQNLPPDVGNQALKTNASLDANLFQTNAGLLKNNSGLNGFGPDTRWMVFKVKQRSSYNYFTKLQDSIEDSRFKFNFEFGSANAEKTSVPDYSYNWPYDYFSLIELGRLSAEHTFEKEPEPSNKPGVQVIPEGLDLSGLLPERSVEVEQLQERARAASRNAPDGGPLDRTRLPNFGLIGPERRVTTQRSTPTTNNRTTAVDTSTQRAAPIPRDINNDRN